MCRLIIGNHQITRVGLFIGNIIWRFGNWIVKLTIWVECQIITSIHFMALLYLWKNNLFWPAKLQLLRRCILFKLNFACEDKKQFIKMMAEFEQPEYLKNAIEAAMCFDPLDYAKLDKFSKVLLWEKLINVLLNQYDELATCDVMFILGYFHDIGWQI